MTAALAALAGATAVVGALTVIYAWNAAPPPTAEADKQHRLGELTRPVLAEITPRVAVAALAVGMLVWWVTGWPAMLVIASGATAATVAGFGRKRDREGYVDKTEAIAVWTEMIRDSLAGSSGLASALVASAEVAPTPIADELGRFHTRARQGELGLALETLQDDLDHPAADRVCNVLIHTANGPTKRVGELLDRLAHTTRSDVQLLTDTYADRAQPYSEARTLTIIAGVFMVVLSLTPTLSASYDGTSGQLVLLFGAAVFATARAAMTRQARLDGAARVRTHRRARRTFAEVTP